MITYAGQYLVECTGSIAAMIAAHCSPDEVFDFQRLEWPGKNRTGWTFPGMVRRRGIVVNSLYWPRDASRWAIGYFLATTSTLASIRQNLQGSGYTDPYTGLTILMGYADLVISEENQNFLTVGKITARMGMLPARPILDVTGQSGLYLITLVDDRYFWWFRDSGVVTSGTFPNGDYVTWGGLYDQAAQALGVTVNYDAINANYQRPSAGLAAQYEQTPLLLDAIAYNVGQRIVVDLSGNVYAFNQSTSQANLNTTLNDLAIAQPGVMYFEGGGFIQQADISLLLPSSVKVTFPQTVSNVDMGTKYPIEIKLSSLGLTELGQYGNGNVKTFHDTCAAEGPTASTPTNTAVLTPLATQIAADWYLYQLGPIDGKFEGIVAWTPEGLSDAVEWNYVKGDVSTRVFRPPWNDLTEELLHGPGAYQPPAWIRVTDSTQRTITLTPTTVRTITDGEIWADDYVLRSATANFTVADAEATLSGTGIAGGAYIRYVNSSNEVVMSAAATTNSSAASVTITDAGTQLAYGFYAVVTVWDSVAGDFVDGTQQVWLYQVNNPIVQTDVIYQCQLFGVDDSGISIWATSQTTQTAWITITGPLQTITLPGGATTSAYPGDITYWSNSTGAWTTGGAAWLFPANGENGLYSATPGGTRLYKGSLLGVDHVGVSIWGKEEEPIANASNYLGHSLNLLTSFQNLGISVGLGTNSMWLVNVQIQGAIATSSTGAGDSLTFALSPSAGTTTYVGAEIECCNAFCDNVDFTDAASLTAIVSVGANTENLDVQAKINTSSGSTGTAVGVAGGSNGCVITAIRLSP